MPTNLFLNTTIPVSLWFVSKDRGGNGHRQRTGEVLFIDARKLGNMVTRKLRVLSDADIAKIANAYHAWRNHDGDYTDVPGFCRVATTAEVAAQDYILTPGRYVGAEEFKSDGEPIQDKLVRLTNELYAEFDRGHDLEAEVRRRLGRVRHGD